MTRNSLFTLGKYLFIGFTILASLAVVAGNCQAASCTPPPAGIAGWWPGEGNANDIVGTNNGTLVGGAVFASGKVGLGFRLDGTNGYVQIPDSAVLKPTNVTVEAWVWLDPAVSGPRNEHIIFKRNSASFLFEGYSLLKEDVDNGNGTFTSRFSFVISRGGNQIITRSTTTIQRGVWYHVAATYDGGTQKLFVNGVLEVSAFAGFALDYGTLPVYIGTTGEPEPYADKLAGIIDEPSLYNRALFTNEIQAIYNAGSAGKCNSTSPAVPALSSFTPASGASGTTLTIAGANFNATAASNIVYLGAVRAVVSSASPTSLLVTIPAGATFAPITVTANGLVAYSASAFEPTFAGNGAAINTATFAPGVNLSLANPITTVIADLDGDGKPDLVVANVYGHAISLLQNTGTNGVLNAASFGTPVVFSVGSGTDDPLGVTVADMDGDGKLDVLVPDRNNNQIVVYRNIYSGGTLTTNSFAPPVFLAMATDPRRVIVRDLDGDGRPEIISANGSGGSLSILRNVGVAGSLDTNSFAPRVDLALAGTPEFVAAGDLDGDGKPDLVVADSAGFISLYRNHSIPGTLSAGSFDARTDLPAQSGSQTVVIGDLDGDGKPELITSAYLPQTMSVYRNLSVPGSLTTNSFAGPVNYPLAGRGHSIALGDLNGDGKPDIAEVTELSDALSLFQNIGAGGFTSTSLAARVDYATGWNAWGVAVGDLDGDGRPDAVLGNVYDNTLTLYKNIVPFGATSTCTPAPAGLVGWWKGDGNTLDSVGGNDGVNQNVAYSNGVAGQAFAFDPENLAYGTYSGIQLADQPAYVLTNSLTIEGWVRPRGDGYIIFCRGDHRPGLDPYFLSMNGNSNLDFFIVDAGGNTAKIETTLPYFIWTHVAATLDGSTGTLSVYTNGVLAVQTNTVIRPFGDLLPDQSPGVGIGNINDGGNSFPFLGDLDEISLYNRALSVSEIQSLYHAGSLGKCPFFVAPVIITQPTNQTVLAGGATGFSAVANGTQPLIYQWNFNGTNISGATNSTLTLAGIQAGQAGSYAVLVTNLYGAATSFIASLTVTVPPVPPTILSQTPSQIVLLGNPATFTVNVSGSGPLSYFWSRDGALISGATNFSYTLGSAQLTDSGSKVSCFVTNAVGSAASTNATLKVIDSVANDLCSGPVVVTSFNYTNLQSTTKATSFGDPVPSCITDFGNGVWYQFTAPLNGQLTVDTFGSDFDTGLAIYTGACDALTEITCNDDTGGMTSQLTLPTTAGATYSILIGGYSAHTGNLAFHLNYLTPPVFAVQPTNQSVVVSSNASFSATLTGALPMTFQWFFNGAPLADNGRISGSATASLSLSNITTADAGSYTLAATNFLGSASSAAAVLNVLVPATISTPPVGRSVPPGLPTTFSAAATGNPTPNYYQWQLNGTNIPGATSSTYSIAAVTTNHLGFYHLIASNSVGGTVSADAQLTFGQVAAWGRNLNNECLPPPNLSNVVAVAGSFGASFAMRTDGTVAAWGTGNATNLPASASNVVALAISGSTGNYALRSDGRVVGWNGILPPALSNLVAIAAGNNFSYAVRAEGTITSWGTTPTPGFPAGLSQITAIAGGVNNAFALRSDGKIFVSGAGAVTNIPAAATNVIAIAAGDGYALALKADGKVVAWGSGTITNLPAGLTNIVALSGVNNTKENFVVAVRANGTVVAFGDNGFGETNPPAALTNLVAIAGAAAPFHGLALVNDGSPVIIHPPIGLTAYAGRDVTLRGDAVGAALLSYQWLLNGTNLPGATATSLVLSNVQFANAGNYQLFVSNSVNTALSLVAPLTVLSNNTLTILSQQTAAQTNYQGSKITIAGPTVLGNGPLRYQWFFAPTNQIYAAVPGATNDTFVLDPALAIHTGNYYVAVSNQFAGITNSPAFVRVLFAKAWGYLALDPPGSLNVTNATAIAVGNAGTGSSLGHYLVLKSDGKISSWTLATSGFGETNFTALSNSIVTLIAAGYQDSLALKSDGTVFAVGYNVYGEINVPVGLNGVTAIASGDYHDLALKSDGTVTGWGQNNYLQTTNTAATNVVGIAASGQNSMILRADGSVFAWGANQFSIPFNVTNTIAIACGSQHFLALRANGTVVGWGVNSFGQTTIATNLTNIVAIAAAANHSTLLRNDGTVVTLGSYTVGATSSVIPTDLANVVAIADSGDHDLALFGTRAPAFTVQPWNRVIPVSARTNIILAAKCAGVQPMSYQWQLNGTNLPGANGDTLLLTNQPSLQFGTVRFMSGGSYQLIASNAYGIALSKPAKITIVIPLGDALDATNLNWLTSGSAQWFGQTNYVRPDAARVNASAARSGGIGAGQETILQTTFVTNVAGSVIFWWKVSSEQFFDTLEFRINGNVQASISGEVDWTQASFPLAAGTNVLMWRYFKDGSFDSGLDSGFVDEFAFAAAPVITRQPAGVLANFGNVVSLSVTTTGTAPMRYQWFRDGSPISGGISSTYTMLNVARAQDGTYSVIVTNSGGMATSSNATVLVKVPQLLGSPVLLPDGSLQFNSTDANGGLLSSADLANFEAQASTNLVDWVTLPSALSLTNGMLQLQDAGQSNYNARYYRILEH